VKHFEKRDYVLKPTVEEEIKLLKSRVSRLERYYHSNLKYIKDLYAAVDKLKKNGIKNGN
jgi:hypothetical protein